MPKRRLIAWLALAFLALGLVVGFVEVMERRFAEGDVYPHYASYRSDPLGTSALYESLERMEGVRVRRNITHLNRVGDLDGGDAILLLGYPREGFRGLRAPGDSPVMKAVEEGARLVIVMNPGLVPEKFLPVLSEEEEDWLDRRRRIQEERRDEMRRERKVDDEVEHERDEEAEKELEKELEEEMASMLGPLLTRKLGFAVESLEEFERPDGGWETVAGEGLRDREPPLSLPSWYSQFRLETESPEWSYMVLADDRPVVIERPWGEGSIVIASDAYFVSNEALHLESSPDFLLWMLGGKSDIVFDETIHGTREGGGAMKLIRRYRLHGVFFGLLLFVVLWAWRSASSLAPGSEDLDRGLVDGGGTVVGEETVSGLTRLLRRSVAKSELLERSLETWRDSEKRGIPPETEKQLEAIRARHAADPKHFGVVEAYNEISEALRRR